MKQQIFHTLAWPAVVLLLAACGSETPDEAYKSAYVGSYNNARKQGYDQKMANMFAESAGENARDMALEEMGARSSAPTMGMSLTRIPADLGAEPPKNQAPAAVCKPVAARAARVAVSRPCVHAPCKPCTKR